MRNRDQQRSQKTPTVSETLHSSSPIAEFRGNVGNLIGLLTSISTTADYQPGSDETEATSSATGMG